jgi:hypothetical protein
MHLTSRRCKTCVLTILLSMLAIASLGLTSAGQDQTVGTKFSGMQWRLIGPFLAGRVTAVAGVPGDPNGGVLIFLHSDKQVCSSFTEITVELLRPIGTLRRRTVVDDGRRVCT